MNYDSSNNPSTVLSWPSSSWSQIPTGTMLAAYGTSDTSFNTLGYTSGSTQIPNHSHQWTATGDGDHTISTNSGGSQYSWKNDGTRYQIQGTENESYYTNTAVLNDINNSNYPPYVVVSMWRRTG